MPLFPSARVTSLIESREEPQAASADALLRGVGAPAVKSVEFVSVSEQPLAPLNIAVVLLGAGVGPPPSKQFAVDPKPAKSITVDPNGQIPSSAVVVLTSATLPAVELSAMVPVASGAGKPVVPPAPAASCTR